jgi:anionic cell wall polymer biosynthesis LytR-Cps2A-Psr (LCP) family protein
MDAQKIFLSALFAKVKEIRSLTGLVRLGTVLLRETETDLDFSDLTMLAGCLSSLSGDGVSFVTAPGMDVRGMDGGSYYVLSAPSMGRLLTEHLGAEAGVFDPKGRFLHGSNAEFRRIYERERPYRLYSSSEIGDEGLSIPRG